MNFTDSAHSRQIDQVEHNNDAGARRVVLRAQDATTGDWVNIAASEASDGTFSVQASLTQPLALLSAPVSISSTGVVITGVPGKKIRVYATKIVCSADLSINFKDGASTDISGAMPLLANSGYIENIVPPAFLFETSAGNDLILAISGSGTASGRVSYWLE